RTTASCCSLGCIPADYRPASFLALRRDGRDDVNSTRRIDLLPFPCAATSQPTATQPPTFFKTKLQRREHD
ncbi:MAG: hypothetical protein ABGY24_04795, partial [bacterium]